MAGKMWAGRFTKEVEVNVLVNEISSSKRLLDQLSEELKLLNEKQISLDADILLKENANDDIKKKMQIK